MSSHGESEALLHARARIFGLLLHRLRQLDEARAPPERYMIGQEYLEDPRRLPCTLTAVFLVPGQVEAFEFWQHGVRVRALQQGGALVIAAERKIPSRLWDDLRLLDRGHGFIIGYLASLMPAINRRLLDNRYARGHLLSRTFAIFEAVELTLTVEGRQLRVPWPPSLPFFPPSASFSGMSVPTYVRDYIDSMDAYFRHEHEDCIRRVITAAETFMNDQRWRARPRNLVERLLPNWMASRRRSSFRRRLQDNLDVRRVAGEVINENLQAVYAARNRIVHGGLRVTRNGQVFCDKAIGSLYYLLYRHCGDPRLSEFLFTLHQQQMLVKNFLGQMFDLDRMAKWDLADQPENNIVDPDDDDAMDAFFFGSLRITAAEKALT